jgi:type III restriction enzyme
LIKFLARQEGTTEEEAAKKVLSVTSSSKHAGNVRELSQVDRANNPREWITSVSMLTEGWDVQNVFQIVPQEERAFNSKLLVAQARSPHPSIRRGIHPPA